MKQRLRFPLEIQLFGDDPAPTPTPAPVPAPQPNAGYTQEQLDAIADARATRASDAALKDFFKQQGLSKEEITAALDKYKSDKAANTPDLNAIQAQMRQAQQEAAAARLEKQATLKTLELGIDIKQIPFVLKLADIQLPENGELKDEDIATAINTVLEAVPAFKPQEPQPKPGIVLGANGNPEPKPKGNVSMYDAIAAKLGK